MEVDKYLHSRSRAPDADPPSDAFSLSRSRLHARSRPTAAPRAVTWARTSRPTVQRSGGRGAGHRCQPGDPEGRPRRPREELRHRRRLHRAVLLPHGTDAIRGGAVPGSRLRGRWWPAQAEPDQVTNQPLPGAWTKAVRR